MVNALGSRNANWRISREQTSERIVAVWDKDANVRLPTQMIKDAIANFARDRNLASFSNEILENYERNITITITSSTQVFHDFREAQFHYSPIAPSFAGNRSFDLRTKQYTHPAHYYVLGSLPLVLKTFDV